MKTQFSLLPHRLISQFYRHVFIASIVALFPCLLFFTQAQAQTTSLSIWPPLFEATIKPGNSITQVYRLKNAADDTTVKVSLVPFSPGDEFGHLNLQFGGRLPGYFSLLDAKLPATLNLKAGESRELVLKISLPETAEPADYSAALVVESITAGLVGGSGSVTQAAIAAPILLTITAENQPQRLAKIETFKVTSLLDSFDPVEFTLRVKNQSPTRLQAIGQIKIKNLFGQTVATLPLPQSHILGGSVRQMPIFWNPIFPIGRFTAEAEITPRDTVNTVSQKIVFWVIPYKTILGLVLLYWLWQRLFSHTKFGKFYSN